MLASALYASNSATPATFVESTENTAQPHIRMSSGAYNTQNYSGANLSNATGNLT